MTPTLKSIMTISSLNRKFVQALVVLTSLFTSAGSIAATLNVASSPLVSSTTTNVLPNLMYILDNSGSMASDYMPDYVNDSNKCKEPTSTTGAFSANCAYGHPPYNTAEFNSIYYNPATTYTPPVLANGTTMPAMDRTATTDWTIVPVDGFSVQTKDQLNNTVTSISLVPNAGRTVGYPDIVWCNATFGITAADKLDTTKCKQNSQYIYPNNTGTQATSFNQKYNLLGHPYYYTVSVGEYCTNANLTSCITSTTPSGAYTFPAKLRWCNSSARTNCQAKYLDATYKYAKWYTSPASSTAKIKINADPVGDTPVTLYVTDITVDGTTSIIAAPGTSLSISDTTNATQRNTLASAIAAAINAHTSSPEFTAISSGDEVTITNTAAGVYFGTVAVAASSHTTAATAAVAATGSFKVTNTNNGTTTVGSVTVNGVEIMGGAGAGCGAASYTSSGSPTGSVRRSTLASAIAAQINACTSTPEYTATATAATFPTMPTVTLTSTTAAGATANGTIAISSLTNGPTFGTYVHMAGGSDGSPKTYTIPTTINSFTGGASYVETFSRVDIVPTTLTYAKASSRTDCGSGATCTYDQEMTNFANWYTYYRTRMQMMKTSTSLAFKPIGTAYRVGFITIDNQSSGNYLPIAKFDAVTQKPNWYTKLFATVPTTYTPLRDALSVVGKIYGGVDNAVSGHTEDPVQYSCQQNFALLTTDGYWNNFASPSAGSQLDGSAIDNQDGTGTGLPMFEGTTASDTLADVAKYYYDTDLRQGTYPGDSVCTGSARPDGTTGDVCEDNVFVASTDNNPKQHMTTFTLGLGVDGELSYTSDYKSATSGDYYDIAQGTKSWPVPVTDKQTTVDDLWHAAVNGQGTYFSARDPNQLAGSLKNALQAINSKVGAGAAAATSTLNPIAGDNFAYVASYSTVKWTGNVEAREINLTSGEVSEDAAWCAETVAASTCDTSIVNEDVAGATVAYCVTPSATLATCPAPGILDGTDCKVEVASACTGTMTKTSRGSTAAAIAAAKVGPLSDNRTIYMKDPGSNTLVSFSHANMSSAQQAYFDSSLLAAQLSQWSTLTTTQQSAAGGATLVNYLRGQTGYEDRASNLDTVADPDVDNRLYRFREATLGDALESTPVYVGSEKLNYSDANYGPLGTSGTFKEAQKNRAGTVYIGTNDGMLHAFNSANGEERWAYVPSMVIPNMHKLADKNYSTQHANFVNGDAIVGSICYANCSVSGSAAWKTILVGGLNGGGAGYYALDVTNPVSPTLLWEFTPASDPEGDLGLSFGNAEITKKADGTWVVLITSGYNNTSGTNAGKGILYVLNANTGAIISKYNTGEGDATAPSGLAKISAYINEPNINNTAEYVYGGDLKGNLWRFDINSAPLVGTNPFNLAILKDSSGNRQPITVRPTLSDVSGKRLIIVGTGKYLEVADLTDTSQQSLYAISDDSSVTATLDNPRLSSTMVSQTLVNGANTRSIQTPENKPNYASGRGWYIDLPDTGERQNIPSKFVAGVTLLVPTIVPSNTVCSPGGYGWLNFLNYKTGAVITTNVVASKTNAPIVGINVIYINGKPVVSVVTADNPTPEKPGVEPPAPPSSNFSDHRMIWRELLEDE